VFQAMLGIDPADTRPQRKAAKSVLHRQLLQTRIAELKSRVGQGGLQEAATRAVLYAGMPRGALDERGIAALRKVRLAPPGTPRMTLSQFKAIAREQYFMLLLEPEAAVAAIPSLLPADLQVRRKVLDTVREVLSARGEIEPEVGSRLQHLARLCGVEGASLRLAVPLPKAKPEQAKAS
jgi:hypothetical protein